MKKIILSVSAIALAMAFSVSFASAANYSIMPSLTMGSTGPEVVELQQMLVTKGFLVMPAGVNMGYFGTLTKNAVIALQSANGITPAVGFYGPVTAAKVNSWDMGGSSNSGNDSGSSSTLKGGAGDLVAVDQITSGTETTLGEGKEEKVLGFEYEADDNSDLAITSVRVVAEVDNAGSTRFNRYVDEVKVYMGTKEVGSMDASDFSRSGSTHTGTIALKNAIVTKGDKERFYVAFVGKDVIDSDDLDNTIDVTLDRTRFEDATGAILTDDTSGITDTVDFEDGTVNDGAKVQSDSSTPDSAILKVEDSTASDDYEIFSFKIKTDSDSSDLNVLSLPIELEIYNASTTAINTEDLIKDFYVEMGGDRFDDYDFDDSSIAAGATETVIATLTIDEGDFVVGGGDTENVKVFVQFGKQDGKYADADSTVTASVTGGDIDAENNDGDTITLTGSSTGNAQTVAISAASVSDFSWTVGSVGTYIDFFFTVEADDEDFDVLSASIASTTSGTATTSAGILTKSTGDASSIVGGFEVAAGDTATFRVRYSISGTNGTTKEVTITSVAGQEVPDNKQVSPTAVVNVN